MANTKVAINMWNLCQCYYQIYFTGCKIGKALLFIYILADSGFFKNLLYKDGVKSTFSWVFEDLKFKISEGYDQNWCFPDPAQLAVSV